MTNFEKYADEIKKLLKEKKNFGFNKYGKVADCLKLTCTNCKFEDALGCNRKRIEWLYEEAEKTKEDIPEGIYKDYLSMCNQQSCDDCPYKREHLKTSCEMAFMYDYLKEKGSAECKE